MSINSPVKIFCILLLALFLPLSAAATPQIPAQPSGYVVDLAGVIDGQRKEQLNNLLRDLERKTTAQMVILTIKSLDGQDINSFSLQTAEQWKIGRKGKDNGLLFVVAMQDRKYRFEVGYGLESILPDSLVGSIGRKFLVPYFKQGQYGEGIAAATGAVLNVLAKSYGVTITGIDTLPAGARTQAGNGSSGFLFFFFILIGIVIVYSRSVNKRLKGKGGRRFGGPGIGPVIFPGGGGWGGGSSGGFGGFSGGGGGFGGGGASGGW